MFSHPGVIHAILLAVLLPILFVVRRAVPQALKGPVVVEDMIAIRVRRLIVLELIELALAAVFLLVGGAKLLGDPDMVALFRDIGVGQWFRYATGVLEVIGATLMVVPLTSGGSAIILGGIMIAATLIEVLVLHRPPIAAAACLGGHMYVAWARLNIIRSPVRFGSFVSIVRRCARRLRRVRATERIDGPVWHSAGVADADVRVTSPVCAVGASAPTTSALGESSPCDRPVTVVVASAHPVAGAVPVAT